MFVGRSSQRLYRNATTKEHAEKNRQVRQDKKESRRNNIHFKHRFILSPSPPEPRVGRAALQWLLSFSYEELKLLKRRV